MFDTVPNDATIGFVDVGQMGLPMARNVLDAGFQVVACDVREAAVAAVEDHGGAGAATPAAVAKRSLGVHVMVVVVDLVVDVTRGDEGSSKDSADGTAPASSTVPAGQRRSRNWRTTRRKR